jgi:hypothetical protein
VVDSQRESTILLAVYDRDPAASRAAGRMAFSLIASPIVGPDNRHTVDTSSTPDESMREP